MRCARRLAIAGMIVAAVAGAVHADPPDPAVLEDEAYQDFAAGRLVEALRGYERVYRLAPRPEVLFAIGNLQQQLGDCERAIDTLEDYLASGVSAGAAKAEALIGSCRASLATPDPVVRDPAPIVATPPPRRDRDAGRGRRRAALVFGGVAVIAGGTALATEMTGRSHLATSDRHRDEGRPIEGQAELDTANRYHRIAQGAAIGGAGCAVIATVLWISGRRSAAPRVAITPTAGGAVMSWSGGF